MIVNHFEAFSKHVGNTHLIKSSFVVYILFYAKLIPSKTVCLTCTVLMV